MSTIPGRAVRCLISAFAALGVLEGGSRQVVAGEAVPQQADGAFEPSGRGAVIDVLRPCAELGDALSQLRLATLYGTGNGVALNQYEAAYWLAKAAEQGVAEAQFRLGLMYLYGNGVTENSARALEWISRAAAQGFGDAEDLYSYILTHDEPLAC